MALGTYYKVDGKILYLRGYSESGYTEYTGNGCILQDSSVRATIKKVIARGYFSLPENCFEMFKDFTSLISVDLHFAETIYTTNMSSMFYGCSSLDLVCLPTFYTSEVTTFANMFYNCSSLTYLRASNWSEIASECKDSSNMFYNCVKLPNFDATVTDIQAAHDCKDGTTPAGYFGTKAVGTYWMYNDDDGAIHFRGEPTEGYTEYTGNKLIWPGSSIVVEDECLLPADCKYMFESRGFVEADLHLFNTSNCTSIDSMFANCPYLKKVILNDRFNLNDLVYGLTGVFYYCTAIESIFSDGYFGSSTSSTVFSSDSTDLPNFDSNKLTAEMLVDYGEGGYLNFDPDDSSKLYYYYDHRYSSGQTLYLSNSYDMYESSDGFKARCKIYKGGSINDTSTLGYVHNWELRSVTLPEDCHDLFSNLYNTCSYETTINFGSLNVSNVKNMSGMFNGSSIDMTLTGWDTSNVEDMSYMFANTTFTSATEKELVYGFDTSNVTNMSHMFQNIVMSKINLSNFNTVNVTDMSYMFAGTNFLILDVTPLSTVNVKNMTGMFSGISLTSLDLREFIIDNVDLTDMFRGSSKLSVIKAYNWTSCPVAASSNMFYGCSSLPNFDSSWIDYRAAHDKNDEVTTGYFTLDETGVGTYSKFTYDSEGNITVWIRGLAQKDYVEYTAGTYITGSLGDNDKIVKVISEGKAILPEDCTSMFEGCSKIDKIDLEYLDGTNIKVASRMFKDCTSATSLILPYWWGYMRMLDDASYMFYNCTSLTFCPLGYASSNPIDLSYLYYGCKSISQLYLGDHMFHHVWYPTKIDSMFEGCTKAYYLGSYHINTSLLTSSSRAFYNCNKLEIIYSADDWDIDQSIFTNDTDMFYNCEKLPFFDSDYTGIYSAYDCNDNKNFDSTNKQVIPGYFNRVNKVYFDDSVRDRSFRIYHNSRRIASIAKGKVKYWYDKYIEG